MTNLIKKTSFAFMAFLSILLLLTGCQQNNTEESSSSKSIIAKDDCIKNKEFACGPITINCKKNENDECEATCEVDRPKSIIVDGYECFCDKNKNSKYLIHWSCTNDDYL